MFYLYFKKIDLYSCFNVIIDGTMVKNPKFLSSEVFIKCCEIINLSPKDCLVFEDSRSGVRAKSGGFKVIGVGNDNLIEISLIFMKII